MAVESVQEFCQVGGCELPLEWFHCFVVALLEAGKSLFDRLKVSEVVGGGHFSLDDRGVDLYLVEPRCVQGCAP